MSREIRTPTITGTSVIASKFNGGVMIAADASAHYGRLMMYEDQIRIEKITKSTLIACTGDVADFQQIVLAVKRQCCKEELLNPGTELSPKAIHNLLRLILYNRRSKMEPIWGNFIVAGFYKEESYLGYVDMNGLAYREEVACTGFGKHFALPILRQAQDVTNSSLSREQCEEVLLKSLQVLFYRDCCNSDKVFVAVADASGASVGDKPVQIPSDWSIAPMIRGYD